MEDAIAEPLSYSRVSTYAECPRKFELKYVQKIPEPAHWYFSYGKSIHAVLERLLSCHLREDGLLYGDDAALFPTSLSQLLDENWLTEGYADPVDEQRKRRQALRVLTAFFPVFQSTWQQTIYVEHLINTKIDGIPFVGIVDRIDRIDDNAIRIVDYKSAKPREASALTSHRFQVALYASALSQLNEFRGKRFILQTYYLRENVKAEMDAGAENCIAKSREVISATADRIAKGDFRGRRSNRCFSCDYRDVCPVAHHA
ncbi:MAG TPA: PD-(D/E)XK nuclease family protein [Clostridia bacterium]|nr:PD-(D/E)XK nuclease family protein [Clostridia bacterium]